MEVEVIPGVRVRAECEEELYTLRLVGHHSRYEFCARHELLQALAMLCGMDLRDPMSRRRAQRAAEAIVSSA